MFLWGIQTLSKKNFKSTNFNANNNGCINLVPSGEFLEVSRSTIMRINQWEKVNFRKIYFKKQSKQKQKEGGGRKSEIIEI